MTAVASPAAHAPTAVVTDNDRFLFDLNRAGFF